MRDRALDHAELLVSSVDPLERQKAQLILDKGKVDATTRELRQELAGARRMAAATGRYMDPRRYTALESAFERSKQESQRLQARIAELSLRIRERNRARGESFMRAFYQLAKERLDAETFERLEAAASDAADGQEEDE